MGAGGFLQIIMIATGAVLLVSAITSLAKRKMTEPLCLTWGLIAIMIMVAGIVLRPVEVNRFISWTGLVLVVLVGFCFLYGLYFMSGKISELMRKNVELSMQMSLINQEKEEIYEQLKLLSKKIEMREEGHEENSVRN